MYVGGLWSSDKNGSNGLICGWRNFTERDTFNADGSQIPLDPDTFPQVRLPSLAYIHRVFIGVCPRSCDYMQGLRRCPGLTKLSEADRRVDLYGDNNNFDAFNDVYDPHNHYDYYHDGNYDAK